MKASINWIKELLPTLKASPATIERKLTHAGLEVEGIESQADTIAGVVVGEVKALREHPSADRLRIAEVFDGHETHTVICGAPNVAQGQKVAFARVGTTLPGGLTLSVREIRGVLSSGMICSERELGLSENADGILVLPPRARPGRSVAERLGLDDVVLDISVTPNRPDVLSHFGLARELAAIFRMDPPRMRVRLREGGEPASNRAKIEIRAPNRCPRYFGRVLAGVKVGPSPEWLVRRLEAVGIRSISNVVDATNLVLMELGHPLHAFDLEKLQGHKIIVRTAKAGEKITTLDGVERTLDADDLVIADAKSPVAIAGVMGGAGSEVGEQTVDLLLESAMFDPGSVRRTSKRHGLHTEASHRFERGADPLALGLAIDRCAALIVELGGGQVLPGRIEVIKKELRPKIVPIRPARAAQLLGRQVDRKEVQASLVALGLRKTARPKEEERLPRGAKQKRKKNGPPQDALFFEVPSWRTDLSLEVDLIEEVARLAGYDSIPTVMPPMPAEIRTSGLPPDPVGRARRTLVSEGFTEAISLAFASETQLSAIGCDLRRAVAVANPLGEESAFMRMSMIPALLRAARVNQAVLRTDLRLFEIGSTFEWGRPVGELPEEETRIGLVLRGLRHPPSWAHGSKPPMADVYDLKGVLEALLEEFCVTDVVLEESVPSWLHPTSSATLRSGDRLLGHFGELHPDVAKAFDLEGSPVFVAELGLGAVAASEGPLRIARPLPKHPAVWRDLSFFLGSGVFSKDVLATVREAAGPLLEEARIFDVYEREDGSRSVAVRMTFRAPERTLVDKEVDQVQAEVMHALEERLHASIRAG